MKYLLLLLALFLPAAQADICAQTGVFVCDKFENPATLAGTIYAGSASTAVVEGNMLRFTIPTNSDANAGGMYLMQGLTNIGAGESVYYAYRIRADETATSGSAYTQNWPQRKDYIYSTFGSSCTALEFVTTRRWTNKPWHLFYNNCGYQTYDVTDGPYNWIFQYSADGQESDHHWCEHQDDGGAGQDCLGTTADVWEDHYVAITLGDFGVANSSITLWARKQGGAWKKWLETTTAVVQGGTGAKLSQMQLTTYMSGKNSALVHPTGHVDYDYLVMSTSPLSMTTLGEHPYPGDVAPPAPQGRSAQRSRVCFAGACVWVVNPPPALLANAPSWLAGLTPGEWTEISLNTMRSVDPKDDPLVNLNHPSAAPWAGGSGVGNDCVISCWNGGAFATGYGTYGSLLTFGGGHTGYHGSEVYAFDMESRLWHRATDPWYGSYTLYTDYQSDPDWKNTPPDNRGRYPDGSPLPAHTNGSVVYVPATNEFGVMRGIYDVMDGTDSANAGFAYFLNLTTKTWRITSEYSTGHAFGLYGGAAVYDEERDFVYMIPADNRNLIRHDVTEGTYENSGFVSTGINIFTAAAIDPNNDLMLFTNFRNCTTTCAIMIRDLLNFSTNSAAVIQNGTPPTRVAERGWEWSNKHQGFIYNHGACLYLLTKDSATRSDRNWTWSELACSETTPQATLNSSGTFNRFRIAAYGDEEVAVVVNRADGPVYAMRLP